MDNQATLFNLNTMRPYRPAPSRVCGHCGNRVDIRNDAGRHFLYCGITECPNSIIGCRAVKSNRRACGEFFVGRGEHLRADRIFREVKTTA